MEEIYIKRDSLNKWVAKQFTSELISIGDLIDCIEDLSGEVENLEIKIEELERDIEENYRPISKEEQYEVGEDDFI